MTDLLAYDYLKQLIKEQFPETYLRLSDNGNLRYELTNIMELCAPLMKGLNHDDCFLKYEVICTISDYLQEE